MVDLGWKPKACLLTMMSTFLVSASMSVAASPPYGIFLLYPQVGQRPTSGECEALVREVKPSREKAEAWLWGRAPMNWDLEFYLLVGSQRIETTYSGEGDYDSGSVRFSDTTVDGRTMFTLIPDDHSELSIEGTIEAPEDSLVVMVRLDGLPDGTARRESYFCRFDQGGAA